MIDDATTLLEPLEMSIHDEGLAEVPFDVVVSQRSHDEKLAKKVVHTQIECSTWGP
jgi:hypothetical protein